MLNTKKLIYVLPDVAYLAELLPGKKPHSHTIQSFKQINGKFIDGTKLLTTNITKLFSKFESGEYALILPDQIFTNTIINIEAESEAEVKDHIKEQVLDSIHVSPDSHLVETFVLTEFKGTYKVQLAAVQKSMLQPVKAAEKESEVRIEKTLPLSWTIKSLISLEPSISVVQLGENLFLAKHYIGVDQPVIAEADNTDKIVETVKTLKGSEPSIQTVYLLSNEQVEAELKEKLTGVLPVQQMADDKKEAEQLPSFVQEVIKASMKTISIPDFAIPEFDLAKIKFDPELLKQAQQDQAQQEETAESQDKALDSQSIVESTSTESKKELPKPGMLTEPGVETEPEAGSKSELEKDIEEDIPEAEVARLEVESEETVIEVESSSEPVEKPTPAVKTTTVVQEEIELVEPDQEEEDDEVDLSQFATHAVPTGKVQDEAQIADDLSTTPTSEATLEKQTSPQKKKKKKVIKNSDGLNNFLKMFFIGLASFAVTVAIGVGIGLGVLQLSKPDQIESPVVETPQLSPTPEPTATPTPLPEINKEELAIKVVNATTQSGYAGRVSAQLEDAGYGTVTASNARGEYEEGFYLLMAEENEALLQTMAKDTDFELTFSNEVATEDPQGSFDAVLVLAE
ncbi:MAG: hypothetical protein GF381_04460 [Candidatus Pacebacteria bacterium]|nr:hypothetical protein [Candidatus Paceibacterota bacterium]